MRFLVLLFSIVLQSTFSHASTGSLTGLDIPFCDSTQSQLAQQPEKLAHFKSALSATVDYYQYLSAALTILVSEKNSSICARALVVGQNVHFAGLSKLQYYFQFEVSKNGQLNAKVPVIMVNTSEQGHMNPSSKQWMILDNEKIKSIFETLKDSAYFTTNSTLNNAPKITGPDFVNYILSQPFGRGIIMSENVLTLKIGESNGSEYYLMSAFVEKAGIVGDKTQVHKALLFKREILSGQLSVSESIGMYSDVFIPISESRTLPPLTIEKQIEQILENSKLF